MYFNFCNLMSKQQATENSDFSMFEKSEASFHGKNQKKPLIVGTSISVDYNP